MVALIKVVLQVRFVGSLFDGRPFTSAMTPKMPLSPRRLSHLSASFTYRRQQAQQLGVPPIVHFRQINKLMTGLSVSAVKTVDVSTFGPEGAVRLPSLRAGERAFPDARFAICAVFVTASPGQLTVSSASFAANSAGASAAGEGAGFRAHFPMASAPMAHGAPAGSGGPAVGVSSFGFGGSMAHMIVRSYDAVATVLVPRTGSPPTYRGLQSFPIWVEDDPLTQVPPFFLLIGLAALSLLL